MSDKTTSRHVEAPATSRQPTRSRPRRRRAAVDPRLLVREEGLRGYLTEFKRKLKGGELGSLPVIVGLIIIWTIFQSLNGQPFLSSANMVNISYYLAGTGMIAVGIVFVLLLGEIDLSVALGQRSVARRSSRCFTVTHGMNEWLAMVLAVAHRRRRSARSTASSSPRSACPAFVVTLAGNLGWNGLMLWVLGSTGTLNLDRRQRPDAPAGPALLLLPGRRRRLHPGRRRRGGAAARLAGRADRRRKAGVPVPPDQRDPAARRSLLAVVAFVAAFVLNQYRRRAAGAGDLPGRRWSICDFVLRRTTFGRKVFAVGGSIEAARRAGINVAAIRIAVFVHLRRLRRHRRPVPGRPDLHRDPPAPAAATC